MPAGPPPAMRQVVASDSEDAGGTADLGTLVSGVEANSVSPVNAFLNWWDGNELWLSGLAFVLQAMVVMPVVLVVAYITATLLDGLLGRGIKLLRRARHADGAPG
jgi:hypothetical protein